MKNKVFITLSGLLFLASSGFSQAHLWTDTIPSGAVLSHMYLNIEVSRGNMMLKSSQVCGASISKLSSPNSLAKHQITTETDQHGNHQRKVVLTFPETQVSQKESPTANMRLADQISDISLFGEGQVHSFEYLPDPSMSTDLYLNLGTGVSTLDLSDLSLKNVSINSAFADVLLSYAKANQVRMNEMDIHAAKADIRVENIELANAELITIQNDMGGLELILGNLKPSQSTIYLQLGVGSCSLELSEQQAVHLVLKSGLFSTVKIGQAFFEQEKGVYVNAAYQKLEDKKTATRIICNIDMGSITVEGKK